MNVEIPDRFLIGFVIGIAFTLTCLGIIIYIARVPMII